MVSNHFELNHFELSDGHGVTEETQAKIREKPERISKRIQVQSNQITPQTHTQKINKW